MGNTINKLLSKVLDYSKIFILIIFLITSFFAYKIFTDIHFDPDFTDLYPENNKRMQELASSFGIEDKGQQYIFLAIEGDDIYQQENLELLFNVAKNISKLPEITAIISPFNFSTFTKKGVERIAPWEAPPFTPEKIESFRKKLIDDPFAGSMIATQDGKTLNLIFTNKQVSDPDPFMTAYNKAIKPLIDKQEQGAFKVYSAGTIILADRVSFYLSRDMRNLLGLSILVILVILFISFKSKRAIFFPLITVVCGMIWSLGFMALLKFSITIVTILVPALILSIGSSYTVHILNEYNRDYKSGRFESRKDWVLYAVAHIDKTIIFAGLTTIIGFSGLYVSSMSIIREFCIAINIGIISCVLLSLFLLPALLVNLKEPKKNHTLQMEKGLLSKISSGLPSIVFRFRWIFIILLPILAGLSIFAYTQVDSNSDYITYFPEKDPIVQNTEYISGRFGGGQTLNITIKAPNGEKNYFLKKNILEKISNLETELSKNDNVVNIISYPTILKSINKKTHGTFALPEQAGYIAFISRVMRAYLNDNFVLTEQFKIVDKDFSTITIYVNLINSETKRYLNNQGIQIVEDTVAELMNQIVEETDVTYGIWGNCVLFKETSVNMNKEQLLATILALFLVFAVSVVVFRSFKYGILSLIPLMLGIIFYYITLIVAHIKLDMATVLVTNIAIGVGIDDAIHYLLRFKHIYNSNGKVFQSAQLTSEMSGRPIILTTISIVSGLLVLCFSSFKPINFFAILICICLFMAMVGTLVFMPAFISIMFKDKEVVNVEENKQ